MVTVCIARRIFSHPLLPAVPVNTFPQLPIPRLVATPSIQQSIPRVTTHHILQQAIETMHGVRHWYTGSLTRDDFGEGLADDGETVELMISRDKRQQLHCVYEGVERLTHR